MRFKEGLLLQTYDCRYFPRARGRKCVTVRHFENTLRTEMKSVFARCQNMEYVVQLYKVSMF